MTKGKGDHTMTAVCDRVGLADTMEGGRSPAMPARADQEEQCALNG
jgi:hypothetical protein